MVYDSKEQRKTPLRACRKLSRASLALSLSLPLSPRVCPCQQSSLIRELAPTSYSMALARIAISDTVLHGPHPSPEAKWHPTGQCCRYLCVVLILFFLTMPQYAVIIAT